MATTKVLIRAPQAPERRAAARMTGRYLVTIEPDAHREISTRLNRVGLKAASPLPRVATSAKPLPDGSQLTLRNVGVALVDPKPDQEDALHRFAAQERAVIALEPERIVRAVEVDRASDYLRGWRDAVDALAGKLLEEQRPLVPVPSEAAVPGATWGLAATKVINTRLSGANIKVAILDAGLDLSHPDFAQRQIVTKNFVGDQQPFHDGVGHGTHCTGTATGPLHPATVQRYGIAFEALIFSGRYSTIPAAAGTSTSSKEFATSFPCRLEPLGSRETRRLARPTNQRPSARLPRGAWWSLLPETKLMIRNLSARWEHRVIPPQY